MPVRVAVPGGVGGLTDGLLSPAYSTSMGLLLWAARVVTRARAAALRVGARGWLAGQGAGVASNPVPVTARLA